MGILRETTPARRASAFGAGDMGDLEPRPRRSLRDEGVRPFGAAGTKNTPATRTDRPPAPVLPVLEDRSRLGHGPRVASRPTGGAPLACRPIRAPSTGSGSAVDGEAL